jgi:hypothetical protein
MSDIVAFYTEAQLQRTSEVTHLPFFQHVAPVWKFHVGFAICISMLQGMRLFER